MKLLELNNFLPQQNQTSHSYNCQFRALLMIIMIYFDLGIKPGYQLQSCEMMAKVAKCQSYPEGGITSLV